MLVPKAGFEPARLAALPPQDSVSTRFHHFGMKPGILSQNTPGRAGPDAAAARRRRPIPRPVPCRHNRGAGPGQRDATSLCQAVPSRTSKRRMDGQLQVAAVASGGGGKWRPWQVEAVAHGGGGACRSALHGGRKGHRPIRHTLRPVRRACGYARERILRSIALLALLGIPMTAQGIEIQGHRGARGLLPENTVPAFERAIELGVDVLELDLGMTRDGVPVVHHDRALAPDRTRDAAGAWLAPPGPFLSTLDLAELAEFDVGRAAPDGRTAEQFPRGRNRATARGSLPLPRCWPWEGGRGRAGSASTSRPS